MQIRTHVSRKYADINVSALIPRLEFILKINIILKVLSYTHCLIKFQLVDMLIKEHGQGHLEKTLRK